MVIFDDVYDTMCDWEDEDYWNNAENDSKLESALLGEADWILNQ